MAQPRKIDILELDRMVRAKKSNKEIASCFGVSVSAVCQAKKAMKTKVVKVMALEKAHEVTEQHLDALGQMRKINNAINEELDRAKQDIVTADEKDKKGLQEIIVKLAAEVRKQLSLQLEIASVWHDQKIVAEFQKTVLDIIGEVEPAVRNEIIRRLKQRKALRGAVSIY